MSRAMTVPVDRRQVRRYKLQWATKVKIADLGGEGREEDVRLRDLSANGAFVYLEDCPTVGEKLLISIKLPLQREIWMNYWAVVVRVEAATESGIAMRFDTSRPTFGREIEVI